MRGDLASTTILRAAALLDAPVRVGSRSALAAGADGRQPNGQFEAGYALGVEEGRAAGFEQGHAEGWRAGRSEGLADAATRLEAEIAAAKRHVDEDAADGRERISQAIASLREARRTVLADAEEELATLALELACKVLGPALASADGIRAQVRLLLAECREPVDVHVHPSVAEELASQSQEGLRWVADTAVELGGARLRHGATSVDARLETVLDAFKEVVLRSLDGAMAPVHAGAAS